jgi:RNA polymerase sigma-70 factor (ECF subfamily)
MLQATGAEWGLALGQVLTAAGGPRGSQAGEEALVEKSRAGDAGAFGALVERHYRYCLKLALSILRNRGDAEDEVQNSCWKAWERIGQYQGEGPFSAWLSRIVWNQCLMRIRQRKCSRLIHLDEGAGLEGEYRLEIIDQEELPEEEVGEREVAELVRAEIRRLPPLLRTVMTLRDVEQRAMPEVAAELGLSVPAAKSRLMRARAELVLRLKKHCGRRGKETLTHRPARRRTAYVRAN